MLLQKNDQLPCVSYGALRLYRKSMTQLGTGAGPSCYPHGKLWQTYGLRPTSGLVVSTAVEKFEVSEEKLTICASAHNIFDEETFGIRCKGQLMNSNLGRERVIHEE